MRPLRGPLSYTFREAGANSVPFSDGIPACTGDGNSSRASGRKCAGSRAPQKRPEPNFESETETDVMERVEAPEISSDRTRSD
jgi:hypothetical protein